MSTGRRTFSPGFTMVEVIIAVALLSIVGAGTTTYLVHLNDTRYRLEAIGTRDALNLHIKRAINPANIDYSKNHFSDGGNAQLANCINGGNCTATNANNSVPFVLGYNFAGVPQPVAGTTANPVFYCHDGNLQSAANPCKAEWQASAAFAAVCPNTAPSCTKPYQVRVGYKLTNIALGGQSLLKPPSPLDATATSFTSVNLNTPQAGGSAAPQCNGSSVIVQVNPQGQPTCACLPGTSQTGWSNGQPICALPTLQCPNGQVATGFDTNLNPICRTQFRCTWVPQSSGCSGFVNNVQRGGCSSGITITKKGGTNGGNNCSQDNYECCTSY